jgi:hypothetical protein
VMAQRAFERIRRVELSLGIEPSHYEQVDVGRPPRPATDPAEPDMGASPSRRPSGASPAEDSAGDDMAAPVGGPE